MTDAIFLTMCLIGIVPAEIFDTRTRSKGVSIGCMVSYAFNTMIGQVTPIAIGSIGYKYYYLFIVCNFTNALFFCKWCSSNEEYQISDEVSGAIQPETAKRPLEEMNYLFTNAPLFVPTMRKRDFEQHDLEHRVEEVERKGSLNAHVEEKSPQF